MSKHEHNVITCSPSTIVVAKDKVASEVARSMIESEEQREPFYIFDFDTAYECVKKFRESMPRVQMFYAMKANDHEMILKLAIALGLGFDCASPGEINKIRMYNIPPTSIIYAVTLKTAEQMEFARKSGVRHTTFDTLGELKRLKQYWPDSKLLVRVKVESDCVYKLGDKFGCDHAEALTLLDEANRLGMHVVGVAFHVGSGCFSPHSYTAGLQTARALFDHEAKSGRNMTLIDIGGGFFNHKSSNFDQVADEINRGLAKWFPDEEVQVVAEPGRFICENAFTLYTNIRDIRKVNDSETFINMIFINNGTYGSLRYLEKWHANNILKRTDNVIRKEDKLQDTIICGPTMEDNDVLETLKLAPTSIKDWIVFHDHGSYCAVFKSEYCGMEKVYTRSVVSEELWFALKEEPIFSSHIFVLDNEVTPILPSTLPPAPGDKIKTIIHQHFQGFKTYETPAYIREHSNSDDVARTLIGSGKQKQPFYIFNMDEARIRVQHFQEMMPRAKIFYAVKSNDTEAMLKLAAASQLGFSCDSPQEIYKLWRLKVKPKNIIYALPCKTGDEMEYARKVGVKLTTFDSNYELKKIKKYWPDASLLLCMKIKSFRDKKFTCKGCDFETEATNLLDEAARLGLKVVGVAFHVNRNIYSSEEYVYGLQQARALFDYEAKNGRKMDIVDIGGGFLSDTTEQINEVSYLINDALEELFPDPNVQIITEPGRYLCDSAFTLYCSILGVKQVHLEKDTKPVNMIYLNDGFHGTMRFANDVRKLRKFQQSSEIEPILDLPTIIWGPTGDSLDRVLEHQDVKLPRCSSSDWLVMDNQGAYTFTTSTRFSTLEVPIILPIVSKELWKSIYSSPVYQPSDFVLNPDIPAPLPSTLPEVLPLQDTIFYTDIAMLKI